LLRPFEFGGDMSTTAITSQILDLIKWKKVSYVFYNCRLWN
jgi:hypothetical protein